MNMSSPIIIKIYPKTWVVYKPLETELYPQHKCGDSCYFSEDYVLSFSIVDSSRLLYMKNRVSITSAKHGVQQRHKCQEFKLNWILGAIIKLAQESKSCESCLYF